MAQTHRSANQQEITARAERDCPLCFFLHNFPKVCSWARKIRTWHTCHLLSARSTAATMPIRSKEWFLERRLQSRLRSWKMASSTRSRTSPIQQSTSRSWRAVESCRFMHNAPSSWIWSTRASLLSWLVRQDLAKPRSTYWGSLS